MSFISGNVIFSDSTYNASTANEILGTGVFQDNSYNFGVINDAKFLGNSQNNSIVLNTATFYDGAVNNDLVANAVFYGNSSNLGVIVESGVFYGTSCNSGVVSGNAIFADTSSNLGTVQGDASFADTVTSFGEVSGVTGSYVNPVDHQYSYTGSNSGVYWSNDQPLAVGSTLYVDQYHNQTITFTNFEIEGSTYYVNVAGVINYIMAPSEPATHWYDDSSDAMHAVTLNGSVTNSDEGSGVETASFDGSAANYLSVADGISIGTGDFTIEAFIKIPTIARYYFAGDSAGVFSLDTSPEGYLMVTGSTYANTTTPLVADTWTHIAVTREGGSLKLWTNGVLGATVDATGTNLSLSNILVGIDGSAAYPLNGKLAGFRVIVGTALYTSNFAVPTTLPTAVTGTQLLLNFGATAVPTVTPAGNWYDDTSSAAHTVTVTGTGVVLSDEGGGVKAAYFSDYNASTRTDLGVTFSAGEYLGTDDFTVDFWAKQINPTSYNEFFLLVDQANGNTVQLDPGHASFSSTKYVIHLSDNFATTSSLLSDNDIVYNVWQHYMLVRSGTSIKLFINGILQPNATTTIASDKAFNMPELWVGDSNSKIAGFRLIKGTALHTSDFSVPTTLPTAVSGTLVLLNFGATAAPTVTPAGNWYDDASDTHRSITLNGTVTQSDEGGGVKAASFDGASNLTYASNTDFNFGDGDFTVQFFTKPGTQFAGPAAMVTTSEPIDAEGIFVGHRGYIQTIEGNGSWVAGNGSGAVTLTDNAWNHVEYVRSSGTVYAFINGIFSHTYASTTTTTNLNNLIAVGGRSVANQYFVGKIAALQVIKGTALHTADFSVPTSLPTAVSGTVLLLNFGATAVPTVTPAGNWYDDASDTHRSITLNGTVTQSDEGGGVKAASFDGNAANRLSFDSSDFGFGTTPFTWEAFVNAGDNAARQTYNFFFGSPGDTSVFYRERDDQYGMLNFMGEGQFLKASGNFINFQNSWHHIAISFDGSKVRMFVNGVLDFEADNSSIYWSSSTWIGADGFQGGTGYNGKIANIRVVKGTALYTSNFSVPTTLPTATSGTVLLLNFGATAVPTVTWFSWNGYLHTGDSTTDCNGIYPHQSLYSLVSTLTIGTQMYTDGSGDNSAQPNAIVYAAPGPDNVIIDGHIYHWGADGKIDSITSCGGY